MAESKVKDENFFLVSGWMLNRLNLKGVSLLVYSIIYGFSQDGESYFTGSLQYLSDFTNASKPTIIKAVKELVEKGLVIKYENEMNGVKFNKYRANLLVVKNLYQGSQEILPGGSKETLLGGSKETLPNNISLDNKDNISNDIDAVVELYHTICQSFPRVRALSNARKKEIGARLKTYSLDDFRTLFENAERSSFLRGADGGWKATFDWLIKEANMLKVLEGNYADRPKKGKEKVPGWFGERQLDADEQAAIRRMLGEEPQFTAEQQAEAERLRQQFQAWGQ